MKKTLLGISIVIFVVVFMIMGILTVDIDLNLKVRRKINTFLKPYELVSLEPSVFYLSTESAVIDENSRQLLLEKKNTGDTYLNIRHLANEGITYAFDPINKILSIVGFDNHLWIQSDGTFYVNNEKSDLQIKLLNIGDEWYFNLTALNKIESGKSLGFYEASNGASGNIIIKNVYTSYDSVILPNETWIFESKETLSTHQKNQFELSFLFDIKNVLSKTEIIGLLNRDEVVLYKIDDSSWYIISNTGYCGYINPDELLEIKAKSERMKPLKKSLTSKYENPIVMTWEAVYSYNPDTTNIGEMAGLNVISPTWYALENANGEISNKVSVDYLSWASERNYEVWPLVSNSFDIDRTHSFLEDAIARKRFIEYMINEAKLYGYNGINLDFENIYLEDRNALTHFVNELAHYCHQNDLVLSMDVTVMGGSDNWSKCYDHQKLGEIVDFLVIMAYDEYWASSPVSGPVASYDWVLKHMENIAEIVSNEKLIMGIPFYTRVWREYPSINRANSYETDSTAIGMEAQNAFIEKYELKPIWDDVDKLYYATFFEEEAQVKIWIENKESISAKLNIVNELNLKGVAAWRRGFETPEIWDLFKKINR